MEIGFVSLYPKEKEFLYAPLTGLILLQVHKVKEAEMNRMSRAAGTSHSFNSKVKTERKDELQDQMRTIQEELEKIAREEASEAASSGAKDKFLSVYDVRPMK